MIRCFWLAAVIPFALTSTASANTLDDAYEACKEVIARNLVPADQIDLIEFTSRSKPNHGSGDEFYFSFPSGSIIGGSRANPDWLTGSNKPSASCVGAIANRTFSFVTVNGSDVEFSEGF